MPVESVLTSWGLSSGELLVEQPGEFSVRGSIIDFFHQPIIRFALFFDTELISIRAFNAEFQP